MNEVMISAYVTPQDASALRQIAFGAHVTKTDLIRAAISGKITEWLGMTPEQIAADVKASTVLSREERAALAKSDWENHNRVVSGTPFEKIAAGLEEALAWARGQTHDCVVHDELCHQTRALIAQYVSLNPNEEKGLDALRGQLLDQGNRIFERSNMRGHITTSAFVVNRTWDKVLMIQHKALKMWLQPGGHFEGDSSLVASACREVEEETGVIVSGMFGFCPLDIDTHAIPERPEKNEGAHYHHDFVFLAVAEEGHHQMAQEDEVSGVRWVDLDEAAKTGSRMKRMVKKAKAIGERAVKE